MLVKRYKYSYLNSLTTCVLNVDRKMWSFNREEKRYAASLTHKFARLDKPRKKMKLLFPLLALVASSSAFIWKDEMVKPLRSLCIPLFGVAQVCADPNVSVGKREEDLNLAEIVADIGKVVHVIDGFVGGATAKREEQDLCEHIGCVIYCTQNDSIINHCKRDEALKLAEIVAGFGKVIGGFAGAVAKREEQDLCEHIGCVIYCTQNDSIINHCKRDEALKLAEILTGIGKVIAGFVREAVTKREEQDLCTTAGCIKACDDGRFYNICKRDEQLNLADVVANIGKVIHVIDGFVSGAAAKREEQNLCIPINGVPFCGP
ncbi:hypothetical protein BgiBS90_022396 [Biomphalaria glabrata]|nr:hypothetical protein BgiBS90_022396 [Biomphalaria glabrata]